MAFKGSWKATREILCRNIVGLSYQEWFPEHDMTTLIQGGLMAAVCFSSGTQLLRKSKKKTINTSFGIISDPEAVASCSDTTL